MIARVLLRVLAFVVSALVLGLLRRRFAGGRRVGPRGRAQAGPPESLVRDRVCNTFLPPARAVVSEIGGERYYFCSEACRQRFGDGSPRTARPV